MPISSRMAGALLFSVGLSLILLSHGLSVASAGSDIAAEAAQIQSDGGVAQARVPIIPSGARARPLS